MQTRWFYISLVAVFPHRESSHCRIVNMEWLENHSDWEEVFQRLAGQDYEEEEELLRRLQWLQNKDSCVTTPDLFRCL